jgi:hypothetical protein
LKEHALHRQAIAQNLERRRRTPSEVHTQQAGPLSSPGTGARAFGEFWQKRGPRTTIVTDATNEFMRMALKKASAEADQNSLQIFYYSGHAVTETDGTTWLFPIDGDVDRLRETSISTSEIRDILSASSARTQVLFLNVGFLVSLFIGAEGGNWVSRLPLGGLRRTKFGF